NLLIQTACARKTVRPRAQTKDGGRGRSGGGGVRRRAPAGRFTWLRTAFDVVYFSPSRQAALLEPSGQRVLPWGKIRTLIVALPCLTPGGAVFSKSSPCHRGGQRRSIPRRG